MTDAAGTLPLLAPMSEVAGRLSIQAAARCLEKAAGGSGVIERKRDDRPLLQLEQMLVGKPLRAGTGQDYAESIHEVSGSNDETRMTNDE